MRKVTLYEVKATEMMAGSYQYLERYVSQPVSLQMLPDGGFMMPLDRAVQIERMQVHCIRKVERRPGRGFEEDVVVHDRFIAIAPDLEEILEAPFEAKVQSAEHSLRLANERIKAFNSMRWWKRAWKALRGSV